MNDMALRIKYIRQIIGYYFLFMLCQLGGEVIVSVASGEVPLVTDMNGEQIAEKMVEVMSAHAYAVLAVTYILLAVILLIKKRRPTTQYVMMDGTENRPKAKYALLAVLMGVGGCVWAQIFTELLPRKTSAYSALGGGQAAVANADPLWLEILGAVILASFFEEFIFRGIIFSRMRLLIKPMGAVICQAIVFTSMYSGTVEMAFAMFLGIILAIAEVKAGSVWAPIIIRMAFNGTTLVMARFYSEILGSRQTTLAVMICGGALLIISGFLFFKNDKGSPDAGEDTQRM